MNSRELSRRHLLAAAGLVGVAGLSACSGGPAGDEEAWGDIRDSLAGADFAEVDVTLAHMLSAAEIVAVGRLGSLVQNREMGAGYSVAQLELTLSEVLAGSAQPNDVLLFEGWSAQVEAVPEAEMLFFLKQKQSPLDPEGIYRWFTSRGIWTATARADVDTPLADQPPASSPLYADALRGVTSVDGLVQSLV